MDIRLSYGNLQFLLHPVFAPPRTKILRAP